MGIAFVSDRDGSVRILVMEGDGSNILRVTSTQGSSPTWAPDGQRIAFERSVLSDSPAAVKRSDIWIVNVDGTAEKP